VRGATRENDTSDPSRFSRESRESHANNEIRFTVPESTAETGSARMSEVKMKAPHPMQVAASDDAERPIRP